MLYTGTTGFRHTDGINNGRPVVQTRARGGSATRSTGRTANNGGSRRRRTATTRTRTRGSSPTRTSRATTRSCSSTRRGRGPAATGRARCWRSRSEGRDHRLRAERRRHRRRPQRDRHGRRRADVGLVGRQRRTRVDRHDDARPRRHGRRRQLATVQVADQQPPFDARPARHVRDRRRALQLPAQRPRRPPRARHASTSARTTPGVNGMGQDHPITWCKLYDGANVNDGTGDRKAYTDGRTWNTGMGHFGARYTENGGNNNMVKHDRRRHPLGRRRGQQDRLLGHRVVELPADRPGRRRQPADRHRRLQGRQGLLVRDRSRRHRGELLRRARHDARPEGPRRQQDDVAAIPTRADHGNSEDGVLGFTLQPGFDLSNPNKRHVYVVLLAAPRPGRQLADSGRRHHRRSRFSYNQISRWTLTARRQVRRAASSERVILRVPKAKISGTSVRLPRAVRATPARATWAAPASTSTRRATCTSASATTCRRTRRATAATRRWTTAPPSAGTPARPRPTRPTCAARSCGSSRARDRSPRTAEPGVGSTYSIPAGNMFAPGTAKTRPEIYAMGFRQPFTLHTDPKNPGLVGVGEFCHDTARPTVRPRPGGHLRVEPGRQAGLPRLAVLRRRQLAGQHHLTRWNYADQTRRPASSTTARRSDLPSDIDWAPAGPDAGAPPTFHGRNAIPKPGSRRRSGGSTRTPATRATRTRWTSAT